MSECEYARRINPYHDGELGEAAATELAEHLRRCPGCAAELARLRALSRLMATAARPQISGDALKRLHARVEIGSGAAVRRMAWAAAGIAAAVLVACCLWLGFATVQTTPAEIPVWELVAIEANGTPPAEDSRELLAWWIVEDLSGDHDHD
jgi:anti-sigma factor RsiW